MTGVDQVTTSAVRSLSFDVDRVSAGTAFLAALDAVVEACHLCITFSLWIRKAVKIDLDGYGGDGFLVRNYLHEEKG
jgi:hypothetical protein